MAVDFHEAVAARLVVLLDRHFEGLGQLLNHRASPRFIIKFEDLEFGDVTTLDTWRTFRLQKNGTDRFVGKQPLQIGREGGSVTEFCHFGQLRLVRPRG